MSFFKKLFGKSDKQEPETDGKTYLKDENGNYIFNRDALPQYTYNDLPEQQLEHIRKSVSILNDTLSKAFKFSAKPINHPQNLDEYLVHWFQAGFGEFLGIGPDQHAAFLAYNFGQYLVDTYKMEWKIKSDEEGGTQTIVRILTPIELELYPIDSTLRAIQNQDMTLYVNIETKLKKALKQYS